MGEGVCRLRRPAIYTGQRSQATIGTWSRWATCEREFQARNQLSQLSAKAGSDTSTLCFRTTFVLMLDTSAAADEHYMVSFASRVARTC